MAGRGHRVVSGVLKVPCCPTSWCIHRCVHFIKIHQAIPLGHFPVHVVFPFKKLTKTRP